MIKLRDILTEGLDTPYKYKHSFKTETEEVEDEETGEKYVRDILSSLQLITFKTDAGIEYLWYAKRSRYDENIWTIAFGVNKGMDTRGYYQLDITKTGTRDVFRVFATVIDIINSFIEFDGDNNEIQRIIFTSADDNRTKFYINRIVPRIENFKLDSAYKGKDDVETEIHLIRTN